MGDRLTYERFIWFHSRVKASACPNAKILAGKFEISTRTAQRDIEFMRDRLHAPLVYEYQKKGYTYSDNSYELPSLWFSEDNVIALSLAVRLASSIPDADTKQSLYSFLDALVNSYNGGSQLNISELSEKVSVKNVEYSKVNERFFTVVVNALFNERPLDIVYYSPHSQTETQRAVHPLHLVQYMGSWHLIAYCFLRKDLRDFSLSRIRAVNQTSERARVPVSIPSIKAYTRRHFGIIQGGRTKKVKLRFSPSIARWMEEQIWHPEQKTRILKDSSLILTFPAGDFMELIRKILSYGPDVKVISPQSLVVQVRTEIEKMTKVYGKADR